MKHLKTFLLSLTLTFGLFLSQAQIGHINSELLVQSMPETTQMGEELKRISANFDGDYKTQATELQAKYKKYSEEASTKTNEENEKRQQELAELDQKLKLYLTSAREELQKKELELLKPIIESAQKAIQDVANDKSLKYVFDSSPGKGL